MLGPAQKCHSTTPGQESKFLEIPEQIPANSPKFLQNPGPREKLGIQQIQCTKQPQSFGPKARRGAGDVPLTCSFAASQAAFSVDPLEIQEPPFHPEHLLVAVLSQAGHGCCKIPILPTSLEETDSSKAPVSPEALSHMTGLGDLDLCTSVPGSPRCNRK